jgi:hypothetical protein
MYDVELQFVYRFYFRLSLFRLQMLSEVKKNLISNWLQGEEGKGRFKLVHGPQPIELSIGIKTSVENIFFGKITDFSVV